MRYLTISIAIFFSTSLIAQNRVNKLSLNALSNLYTYGEGQGSLNNVVRLGEDINIRYKTYDTVKSKGMIYELTVANRTGYYKNVLTGNTILEVNDLHANLNFIFPILIMHKKNMEHSLGVGVGLGTLMARDYYDENNVVLAYNTTYLKEVKFGRYFTSSLLLDYEFNFNLSKKIGFLFGLRYTTSTPVHSGNLSYLVSQGTGIGFRYGVFYKFK